MQKSLRRAAELREMFGFQLAVVVYPMLYDLDASYPFVGVHRKIVAFADSLGIPALDLLDSFEGEDGPSLWVHRSNQHPNEVAQRIAV